jgi:asparagine synthase (glutamine-hydrolysing)
VCGIAGIFAPDERVDRELVRSMVATLAHRGPDGEGYYFDDGIALGMRRLAIIDPEGGQQPLYNERKDVVVVFNGEIYNHAELRRWLAGRGHEFSSLTDGEVVPHLYEELGPPFVERLNGIFAIALWDAPRGILHLFRDKFGVKPLYWRRTNRGVSFASEIRALMVAPDPPRALDHAAIDHFLTFRFIPSPYTLHEEIRKLPPASALRCTAEGVSEQRYWDEAPTVQRTDRGQLLEEYCDAFERAVMRQMMSDRPVGVMLSGGVDSGAITAVLAKHAPTVRTFTIGFSAGGDTNEVPLAQETARLFGAENQHLMLGPADYLAELPRALQILEEPIGSDSSLAVKFVSQLMRPSVPVALCGQGADEPLGGYWRHLGIKIAQTARGVPGAASLAERLPRLGNQVRFARGVQTLRTRRDLDLLMAAYRLFRDSQKRGLYKPEVAERVRASAPPEATVERLRERVGHLDPLGQMLYVDTRLWLPDELLLIADKMSMAASVELRVPFLDQDLVALVESIDSSQKVRGLSRKSLHKRAMLRWLPTRIVYRKERGWQTPVAHWLRAELRGLLEDVVLGEGEICRELFREDELRRMISTHATGEAQWSRQLFCLLSLGLCYRGLTESAAVRLPART